MNQIQAAKTVRIFDMTEQIFICKNMNLLYLDSNYKFYSPALIFYEKIHIAKSCG
jgi:hypothetical protein